MPLDNNHNNNINIVFSQWGSRVLGLGFVGLSPVPGSSRETPRRKTCVTPREPSYLGLEFRV